MRTDAAGNPGQERPGSLTTAEIGARIQEIQRGSQVVLRQCDNDPALRQRTTDQLSALEQGERLLASGQNTYLSEKDGGAYLRLGVRLREHPAPLSP